jgi:surface protein
MKKSTRAQSLCPITPSPWQTSHPNLTLTRFSLHQKATLPKTKGTLTNGTLLLLKSLAAFCMLGNVTASPTPTCGCSEAISEAISALRGEFQAKYDAQQVKYDAQQTLINSLAHEVQDLRCSGLTDTAKAKKCKKVSKCTNAKHRSTCKKTCCEASSPPSSPSPPPPSPSPPPPSPSPPPPSPSPPSPLPPSPSPACIVDTFTTKASLKTAVTEFNSNPTAATAKYGPIADWCVSAITDMSYLISYLKNFNADISGWDTSSVTNMYRMFYVRAPARALGPHRP